MLGAATGRHHRTHCKTPAGRCRRAGWQLKAPGVSSALYNFLHGTAAPAHTDCGQRRRVPSHPAPITATQAKPRDMGADPNAYVVTRASHIPDTRIPP